MELRNRNIPPAKAAPKKKDAQKPTGVQKTKPATAKGKGKKDDGAKKPLTKRQQAQAAKKVKDAAQKQTQKDKNAAASQSNKKAAGRKKDQGKKDRPRSESRDTSRATSEFTEMSDTELAALGATVEANDKKQGNDKNGTVNFWLKPFLRVHDSAIPKPRDALSPRSEGVRKKEKKHFGGYALPPFGKPFWQKNKKDGTLELLLPMLVTAKEKKDLEDRGKFGGMQGQVEDFWDRNRDGRDDDDGDGGDDGNEGRRGEKNARRGPTGSGKETGNNAGNKKGGKDDPQTLSSGSEKGDTEDVSSPDSSDSERPPYSIHYPRTAEQRDNPPQFEFRPKNYDVNDLGPEFDGLEDESQMDDAAFLRSEHGYEDGWVGKRILGAGGSGRAGLWEKLNSDGVTEIDQSLPDQEVSFSHVAVEEHEAGTDAPRQYFPEEFIWDVFYHLLNAVKAMDQGPTKPKDPSHTTYVHRDIKTANSQFTTNGSSDEL
ncbi:MAG: hypothetical protein Q9169_001080 [Polycauliona sp. 2 TL-2023]